MADFSSDRPPEHAHSLDDALDHQIPARQIPGLLFLLGVAGFSLWEALDASDLLGLGASAALFGLGLLAFSAPNLALSLFFLGLPVLGGHYAEKPQMVLFLGLLSSLIAGLSLRLLLSRLLIPAPLRLRLEHPLAFALCVFFLTACFSLSSLPWDEVLSRIGYLKRHAEPHFVALKEVWVLYPFLKGGLTLQGFFLFLLLINAPSRWNPKSTQWLLCLFLGVVATLGGGLLDYYGVIDLRSLRPLEDWVNPNNIQQRLQSFFGHSAWCAQYLTVAIPSGLILMTLPIPPAVRIGLLVPVLIVGEFVLILTFQRGGWVSYPLTLLVIWFSIHVLKPRDSGAAVLLTLKRSLIKIAVSVPLTLIVSMTAFTLITGDLPYKYIDRFKAIGSYGERTMYIPVALKLFLQHPILGGGTDSFAYRYVTDFLVPNAPYFGEPKPLAQFYNNAHSAYLRTLTGQGAVGLLSLLGLLLGSLYALLRLVFDDFRVGKGGRPLDHRQRIIAMITLSAFMAFGIYGLVDDFFYVPALSLLFFAYCGILVREVPLSIQVEPRLQRGILWTLGTLFCLHLFVEYGVPGTTRERMTAPSFNGCHPPESTPEGPAAFISCSGRFTLQRTPVRVGGDAFLFVRGSALIHPKEREVSIEAQVAGEPKETLFAQSGELNWLVIPFRSTEHPSPQEIVLMAPQGLVPLRDPETLSLDRRRHAVLIEAPPSDPLAAVSGENARCDAEIPGEGPLNARWCQSGGRLTLKDTQTRELWIGLDDPRLSSRHPAWVFIREEGGTLERAIKFTASGWQALPLPQGPIEPRTLIVESSLGGSSKRFGIAERPPVRSVPAPEPL